MDGTETKQDTEAASATKQGTSGKPLAFTEEEVKVRELKAINDYAARTGRREEELIKREQEIKDWEARRQKEETARTEREREAPKDRPEELSIFDRKRKLDEDLRTHTERVKAHELKEAALAERLKKAEALEYEIAVAELAVKHQVDANTLKNSGITDIAQLEKIAALLPKKSNIPPPDSGKTTGGQGFAAMTPAQKIAYGMAHPEAKMT